MKKNSLFTALLFVMVTAWAQVPQGIHYQAVVRDNQGNTIANRFVAVRINIHQSSAGGFIVYSERDTATTNQFGLITFIIGQGTVLNGDFSSINWGSYNYFAEVLTDVTGGTNYQKMGTSQLVSVPYALYAANSANALNTWSIKGNSNTNASANFIGTSDNVPLSFRVNNSNAGRIDQLLNNTSFGDHALDFATTVTGNTATGSGALQFDTSGNYNTAHGYYSLRLNKKGNWNTATGSRALYSNDTGWANTAIGRNTLYSNTKGGYNTALGLEALYYNTTGSYNTAIGTYADVTSGNLTNATAIGYNAKVSASNSLILGGTGANAVNVGIGTPNPVTQLHISGYSPQGLNAAQLIVNNTNTSSLSYAAMELRSNGTGGAYIDFTAASTGNTGYGTPDGSARIHWSYGTGNMTFYTNTDVNNSKMTITSAGNVGIGTANTGGYKLSIKGNGINISGDPNPSVAFNPSIGATKTGILFQTSDQLMMGASGGSTIFGMDLTAPANALKIDNNGFIKVGNDFFQTTVGKGVVIKSPDGNCWRITVDNSGNIITTTITCP